MVKLKNKKEQEAFRLGYMSCVSYLLSNEGWNDHVLYAAQKARGVYAERMAAEIFIQYLKKPYMPGGANDKTRRGNKRDIKAQRKNDRWHTEKYI
jgi:hypothetical protein